jgi:hypothetical protein
MLFNIPQFINIEDKIVGPLTAKQLGWLAGGGVILLILWSFLDMSAFIMAAIIDAAVFGAFAFYRPYNQPLIKFLTSSVYFAFRPRVYIWKREYDNINSVRSNSAPEKNKQPVERKRLDNQKIKDITRMLDSLNH